MVLGALLREGPAAALAELDAPGARSVTFDHDARKVSAADVEADLARQGLTVLGRYGHRIANEFCVDLLAAALHGHRQTHAVAADENSATVTNTDGLGVRIELGPGCRFSDAVTTRVDAPTADSLRLHRVLTDDLEIVAPEGGDFAYRIVLP